jgi:hypothetical protein
MSHVPASVVGRDIACIVNNPAPATDLGRHIVSEFFGERFVVELSSQEMKASVRDSTELYGFHRLVGHDLMQRFCYHLDP